MEVRAESEVAAEISLRDFEAVFWEVPREGGRGGVDPWVGGLFLGGWVGERCGKGDGGGRGRRWEVDEDVVQLRFCGKDVVGCAGYPAAWEFGGGRGGA